LGFILLVDLHQAVLKGNGGKKNSQEVMGSINEQNLQVMNAGRKLQAC